MLIPIVSLPFTLAVLNVCYCKTEDSLFLCIWLLICGMKKNERMAHKGRHKAVRAVRHISRIKTLVFMLAYKQN